VAADIPAGIGYLAGGLAFAVIEVVLIRNRRRFARWQVDRYLSAAARAPRGLRWAYFHWRGERWRNEEFLDRQLVAMWFPAAVVLLVAAVVLFGSAISEFAR
jgi:hypothetical protein